MENYTLYSELRDSLPEQEMEALVAGVKPEIDSTERGLTYQYSWPNLTLICSVMPAVRVSSHLEGFARWVSRISRAEQSSARVQGIIARIRRTRLVVSIEVNPSRDEQGRTLDAIGKLCSGLRPIVFFENALYDRNLKLMLGPGGSFEDGAEVDTAN